MMESKIINTLKKDSLSSNEIVAKFPKKHRARARRSLTALILKNKIGLKDNKYFLPSKPSKMKNKKITIDGYKFDSIKESERYLELKVLLRANKIKDLILQPKFNIISRVKYLGKTLQTRFYIADFKYLEGDITVVEDVKSEFTRKDPVYTLKRQLFLLNYKDLEFREIL